MMKIFRTFWKKIQKMWKRVLQNPILKLVLCHKKEVQKSGKNWGKLSGKPHYIDLTFVKTYAPHIRYQKRSCKQRVEYY